VVLVHGTPSWSYIWRDVAPVLAASFTVYVLDLPGYGDSPAPRDGVSIASHAETFVELLDHLGLDDPAAVGHDIGAAVVLRAHLRHGRAFRRLVLVDGVVLAPWITPPTRHIQAHLDVYRTMPTHVFEQVVAAHLRTATARPLSDEAFAAYFSPWTGEDGQRAYLDKVAGFDERHTIELEPLLPSIRAPTLIVWGREDAWLEPVVAERLGALIPGSEVRLLDRVGHFAMEDAPDEIARALRAFLLRDAA
jgi:pimeloyl-ACP methyl ester carboxylesterase